jgi:hypothetical protein
MMPSKNRVCFTFFIKIDLAMSVIKCSLAVKMTKRHHDICPLPSVKSLLDLPSPFIIALRGIINVTKQNTTSSLQNSWLEKNLEYFSFYEDQRRLKKNQLFKIDLFVVQLPNRY